MWPIKILKLCVPLAVYLAIGMLSMAGGGGYSLSANLAEKTACAAAMGYLFIRDSRVIVWDKKTGRKPDGFFGRKTFLRWFCLTAAAAGACIGLNCLFFVTGLTGRFSGDMEQMRGALYGKELLLEIAVMVIAAPLGEELLFRGVLFRRMRAWCGFLPAALVTALIFGLFHGNILQGAYGFLMGLLFAYSYERLHTVWAPVWMHAAANAVSLAAAECAVIQGLPAAVPFMGMCIGLLAAAAALALFTRLTAEP